MVTSSGQISCKSCAKQPIYLVWVSSLIYSNCLIGRSKIDFLKTYFSTLVFKRASDIALNVVALIVPLTVKLGSPEIPVAEISIV